MHDTKCPLSFTIYFKKHVSGFGNLKKDGSKHEGLRCLLEFWGEVYLYDSNLIFLLASSFPKFLKMALAETSPVCLFFNDIIIYRVEEKYASATVHYKKITFWETPFRNSNFGSYQKYSYIVR